MFSELKDAFKLHSIKLAAAVATVVGILVENKEILFSALALIPAEPLPRAVMAISAAVVVFAGPYVARMWPQENVTGA